MTFVFLRNLSLSLNLELIEISKRRILTEFSLVFIRIVSLVLTRFVFFGQPIIFWALDIDFSYF